MSVRSLKKAVPQVWIAFFFLSFPLVAAGQPVRLLLPTSNDALLYDDGPAFYQFTDRNFEGRRSTPWEGGRYGFVRNQVRTPAGIVYTRFHEGLDIRPLFRDARDEPLDTVRAVSDGRVVYVNRDPRASAYGHYVVVEHFWQGSPYYTLYAHMGEVGVRRWQNVMAGERLGTLGYTGTGIDRRRAHLHFEINLLLSDGFVDWHRENFPRDRNEHGLFNGINLAGMDAATLYLRLLHEPDLLIGSYVREHPWAFAVRVPGGYTLELTQRYPWLMDEVQTSSPVSYVVWLTAAGLPVRIEASGRFADVPELVEVAPEVVEGYLSTNGYLSRRGSDFSISTRGLRYLRLLTMPMPGEVAPLAW